MKTEDKELLLKDLCARLPYGVKFKYHCPYDHSNDKVGTLHGMDFCANSYFYDEEGSRVQIGKTSLPILFPLTCLTHEITIAGKTFVPIKQFFREHRQTLEKELRNTNNSPIAEFLPFGVIDKLNEWHINYRLPDHLFVAVTNEFNPYK